MLNIPHVDWMSLFMCPYIEKNVDVLGDGNCGLRVVAVHASVGEDSRYVIHNELIKELTNHKSDYTPVFGSEKHFQYILNDLHPSQNNGFAPIEKWYIIATFNNKVVVELAKHEIGISEEKKSRLEDNHH